MGTATVLTNTSLALAGTVGQQASETRISSDQLATLRGTASIARMAVEWRLDPTCVAYAAAHGIP